MDGSLLVSPALSQEDIERLGLPGFPRLQCLGPRHEEYLKHHRDVVFQAKVNS